jgi:hypothetical protein
VQGSPSAAVSSGGASGGQSAVSRMTHQWITTSRCFCVPSFLNYSQHFMLLYFQTHSHTCTQVSWFRQLIVF